MHIEDYFRSLSMELQTVKDRVRQMIAGGHWPTDGEWKESVLRTAIRRSAPTTVSVGRGFVISRDWQSPQIDILVHDNSHPVLYRDGDLVFVAPAACKAIVEVKSKVTNTILAKAAQGLATTAEMIRGSRGGRRSFIGLFGYESAKMGSERAIAILADCAAANPHRVIDHVVLGPSLFIKYWEHPPLDAPADPRTWRSYDLPNMSVGYFIHNLLMHLSPEAERTEDGVWFPENSNEACFLHSRTLSGA